MCEGLVLGLGLRAVLHPHTQPLTLVVPGYVRPSRVAWSLGTRPRSVVGAVVLSLRPQGMEGMGRLRLSRSPLLAAAPVAGVPMPCL